MAKIELPVVGSEAGLGRRQWLQGLLGGVGAGIAIPGLAETHPVHAHLADPAKVAGADAKAAAAGWKPEFLDAYQFETLSSLAERILPGAIKLRADRFIDQLLAVDSAENQQAFLSALGGMDGEARARFGKPWKALTEPQQVELLTAASTAPLPSDGGGRDLRPRNAPAVAVDRGQPEPPRPLRAPEGLGGGQLLLDRSRDARARVDREPVLPELPGLRAPGRAPLGVEVLEPATVHPVVVIGSGAAGGMAAFNLTRQGIDVLLLDAGEKFDKSKSWKHVPAWERSGAGPGR